MAYTLECDVQVGAYRFRKVNEVSITSTWRNLSDECLIKLPSLARQLERGITPGDRVEVRLRYAGYDWQTEFVGYVSEVMPTLPLGLRCEDEMYTLKRRSVPSKAWRSITLRALLTELVPDAELGRIPAVTLAPFRLDRVTVFEALRKLKEEYLLAVYFRSGVLFVGLPYTEFDSAAAGPGRRGVYHLQRNIVANNLVYRRQEDVRMGARVVGIRPNNKRLTVHVGDSDGEQRTIHKRISADTTEAALKALVEVELAKYRYEGYRGTLSTFGLPFVIHGGVASLQDALYPQRGGRYLIDQVRTTFGTSGFRREVELGPKAR